MISLSRRSFDGGGHYYEMKRTRSEEGREGKEFRSPWTPYKIKKNGFWRGFGAILDPIADKILLLFCLFGITFYLQDPYIGLISLIILAREFWVSALRDFASRKKISDLMDVTYLAKLKTSMQFLTLFLYFLSFLLILKLGIFVANITLFLSMLITIKTVIDYTKKVLKI